MTRADCISNRNITIISTYFSKRTGNYFPLFNGLPYPSDRYESSDAFFLNEDEWTTYDNFQKILRRAKELSEEPHFYFNCGSSSAMLRSWGRFEYFFRFFAGPDDGFKRIPFFNSNINDTKDIEVILPPSYDKILRRMRVILKVAYHDDIDVNNEYIVDAYRRGIISSIPTLWGLPQAVIRQPLNAYDPVKLLNNEPEFTYFKLDAEMEDGFLSVTDPILKVRKKVGKEIGLISERINNKEVFLGKYTGDINRQNKKDYSAVLITETIRDDDRILLKKGEIFNAPYFILDVTYNRFSWLKRNMNVIMNNANKTDPEVNILLDTINNLRINIKAKNRAYDKLKAVNDELESAKSILENYNDFLEKKVNERTAELKKAQDELLIINEGLEEKVNSQIEELNRYNNIRRYLSPQVAEEDDSHVY
jgi:hypothetical protein